VGTLSLEDYRTSRGRFPTDEWTDLLVRPIGLEPFNFNRRLQLLLLIRLLPLCERNFNLVEVGPQGTGEADAHQELSRYFIARHDGRQSFYVGSVWGILTPGRQFQQACIRAAY
jgi:ATP-dependent Lon protease